MAAEPRWLSANDAASYLNISTEGFRRKVRDGVIPPPSRALGDRTPRWDRLALDSTMSGGVCSMDPDVAAQALVQKILAGDTFRPKPRRLDKPANRLK